MASITSAARAEMKEYLDGMLGGGAPQDVADMVQVLKSLHQRRLWHQATEKLLECAKNPYFAAPGTTRLFDLYQKFARTFQETMRPLYLVRFATAVSLQISNQVIVKMEEEDEEEDDDVEMADADKKGKKDGAEAKKEKEEEDADKDDKKKKKKKRKEVMTSERDQFLAQIGEVVKNDVEAALLVRSERLLIQLAAYTGRGAGGAGGAGEEKKPELRGERSGDVEKKHQLLKDELDGLKAAMDKYPGVMDSLVYSNFYRARLEFHRMRGETTDYFEASLRYLGYTSLEEIAPAEHEKLAAEFALAALAGEKIYQFGELLQHPILRVLDGTDRAFLGDLLRAFNSGDISKYTEIAKARAASPHGAFLGTNKVLLAQKIRVLALIELVFQRPSHDRVLTFDEVAKGCQVPAGNVELLLMKAFSLGVARGVIDQVSKTVQIRWVQPRVLNKAQLEGMVERMDHWAKVVHESTILLENNAPELINNQ